MIIGSCLCGEIRIEIPQIAKEMTICHCQMCQKFFGGPMIALSGVSANSIISGQDQLRYYDSSAWAQRGFCSHCGSSICYRSKEADEVYFAAGLFEDLPDFYVSIEMCADGKADYLTFQPDSRKMTMTEYVNYINTNEV